MDGEKSGCWPIGKAEKLIHACARESFFELSYTGHAEERMERRGIIASDIAHVLENGHVCDEPVSTSRAGYCMYKICGRTPNTENRQICVVVIPNPHKPAIKVITAIMVI